MAACADISICVPVCANKAINRCDKHIAPYIELSPIIQKWPIYIQLQNKSLFLSIKMLVVARNYLSNYF